MTDLTALKCANAKRWAKAKLTRNMTAAAKALIGVKPRYQAVEARTGVPWFVIAAIHQRESSQNWSASLAQGDPWNRVSVHVPAGRGPFSSWEEAAIDALTHCPPHVMRNTDWSIGGTLTMLEQYNGLGYAGRGVPSPYLWAGTDQYRSGKYVRDGVYDARAVDGQPGCAGLLMALTALDPKVGFAAASGTAMRSAASPPPIPRRPTIAKPSLGIVGALIASLLSTIRKRK